MFSSKLKHIGGKELWILTAIYFIGYIAAFILFPELWSMNYNFLHMSLELFGLFLMIFTFFQVWNTYAETDNFVQWVGMGTFVMVFLNLPHLINFADLPNLPYSLTSSLVDVSLKQGVLIAFLEILIWLLLGFYRRGCTVSRWSGLFIAACTVFLFLAVCISIVNYIPEFYSIANITIYKNQADFALALAAILIIAIYRSKLAESTEDREKAIYRYIMLSMCMFIPARVCFALSDAVTSQVQFMGHIFKLSYHFFIYYGVYKATVEYPYDQVRKVKDFYEKLLDASPTGLITFNPEGAMNYASKECNNLFRYDMKNLYGFTLEQLIDAIELIGATKSELLEKLQKLQEGSVTFYGKLLFSSEQGGKLVLNIMKLSMGIVLAVRDAKKAQAIENMQLQTQTVLDSADNLVFILDANQKVVMCNKKFLKTTNTEANEILGLNLMEMSRFFRSNLKDTRHINIKNGNMIHGTKWSITTPGGETRKISLDSAPIYDIDNEKIGWIVIGRDISDYEKEQEKIIHSEKMAVIGQMAAGLVHEIKNPLASIKGLCQLMQNKARAEKVASYAAVMESAVDDIGEIVTNFLQFSRPATGDMEKASLNGLVSSLEMLISTNAYKHGIKTRFCYSNTEAPVQISSQQIKNAILGMVDNAIDALNSAIDPKLDISTGHDKSNNTMCITIRDNGIGMTEEQLACIGTPFYTTKPKGTGLGVSIFKYIANEHGGTLKVESTFGEGTVFTVILPCITSE